MLDLRKELQHTLDVDGVEHEIFTDFRIWIEVERSLRENHVIPFGIFKNTPPKGNSWTIAAQEFLLSKNATPRSGYGRVVNDRAFDFVLDGAYIYASFMQAYKIDLVSIDYMHWHVFKALFDGLPDDTKMAQIMGYRMYCSSNKKYEEHMRELQRIWRLTENAEYEQLEQARAIAEELYEKENHE